MSCCAMLRCQRGGTVLRHLAVVRILVTQSHLTGYTQKALWGQQKYWRFSKVQILTTEFQFAAFWGEGEAEQIFRRVPKKWFVPPKRTRHKWEGGSIGTRIGGGLWNFFGPN